ncbi:MAG: helix-turn-helix transcriptional regulator [Chloroflexi bacterium]|nr:helix-turn-helix transcriptional regulator [Chloroflexota bacterium]
MTSGSLGERVRSARKTLGFSQARLAGEELTKGFISQLESGTVRPSIRSLQIIAARLGKPLDYFLGDEPLATGKRVAFHKLAAESAAERHDWRAVRDQVALALEQSPDGAERAALLHLLTRAEIADKKYERVFELADSALGLFDVASDPELAAGLFMDRGFAYLELGQLVAATDAYEHARDVVERHEVVDTRLRSRILISLGTVYRRLGRTSKAIAAYEPALAMASRVSELEVAARGFMGMAATHYDSGELDTAIANYRRALELFRRISDIDFELNALQSIATVQFESGEISEAKLSARRAMSRALEVGNSRWAAVAEVILARIALREGCAEDCLRMASHAERLLDEARDRIQQADAQGAIGAANEALGRHSAADTAYRRSIEIYTDVDDVADRSDMAAEYARVLRARGQLEDAFAMLELAQGAAAKR